MTMTFFGKLKNLHGGPPAPPKRAGGNAGFKWPQDEFDDEDSDMYEVPPCERPAMKVPQRQVEEDVYLDRTSNPAVPQRNAAPPPRPGKPLKHPQRPEVLAAHEPRTKNPPEVDRNEKPGRTRAMPPTPGRPVPAPGPAANVEEDVYLDPNEEQEDNDDVYLEPTAACAPVQRGPKPTSPSHCAALAPSPVPRMKPPVPRAKSNSFLHSLNETHLAPPAEERRASFPSVLPPPISSVKPPVPGKMTEAKPSLPTYPQTGTRPVGSFGAMRATKQSENEDKEWFAGDCNRKTAEGLLLSVNKDGAFLIRRSSAQGNQPYTLAVLYQQKVYNIPIRYHEEKQGYALGKEGKKNEEIFPTLDEIISHHRVNQLLLIDSKSQAKHTAYLTKPARL